MPDKELNQVGFDELARERERLLDERVIGSLEKMPEVSIPADFATRVAAKVPARRPVAVSATHYGWTVMWACLAVLFVVLVGVAMKGSTSSVVGITVEWTLLAQFLVFSIWLGVRRRSES